MPNIQGQRGGNSCRCWGVVDVETAETSYLSDFRPSEEQIAVFMFFDQYVQSHNPWSSDRTWLVYAGVLGRQGQQLPLPEVHESDVMVEPVAGSGHAEVVAQETFATWSPSSQA